MSCSKIPVRGGTTLHMQTSVIPDGSIPFSNRRSRIVSPYSSADFLASVETRRLAASRSPSKIPRLTMLLPMSMAKSIYRILSEFGAMVLIRLYGKPRKWDNEMSEKLNNFPSRDDIRPPSSSKKLSSTRQSSVFLVTLR